MYIKCIIYVMHNMYIYTYILEKEMVTHSSILAWRIPWTEEPGGLQSMGSQRVRHDEVTNTHTHIHTIQYKSNIYCFFEKQLRTLLINQSINFYSHL